MGKPRPGGKTGRNVGPGVSRGIGRGIGRGGAGPLRRSGFGGMVSRGALSGRRFLRPIRTDRHAVGRQVSQGAVGTVPRGPAEVEVAVEAFEGGDLDRLDLVQVAGDGLDGDPARLVIAIYARDFPHMGLGPTGSGLSDHRHEGAVVTAAVLDLEADPDHPFFRARGASEDMPALFTPVRVGRP